jgi:hypothetical protein
MNTLTHALLRAKAGEPVSLVFTVTDRDGDPVSVESATAAYKIARRAGDAALLTKTQEAGITLSGNVATVDFSTGELLQSGNQLLGDFFGQLKITKDGDGIFVAEGPITVEPVIV